VEKNIVLLTCVFFSGPLFASPAQLKEGNRQFKNGNYEKALKSYEDALIDTPYSPMLKYNAGAAAYQAGDFSKAANYFHEADQNAPLPLRNAAHYNRGNALFRQERLDDAIEAYKDALRLNPNDEDAKYNLSAALRRKQQQPQSAKGGGGGKQDQQKKNDSSSKDQDKGKGESKDQQDKGPKPGQMSQEDAERLTAAAGANEGKKGNMRQGKQEKTNTDEDW
jgi:tetratricopeptide (TPR) repeat protein